MKAPGRRIAGLLVLAALPTVGPLGVATFSGSPTSGGGLSPSLLVGVAALGLAVFGFMLRGDLRARFPRRQGLVTGAMWLCGIIGFAFTISALTEAPAVTAIPNPIPLTVDSVTAGRGVYRELLRAVPRRLGARRGPAAPTRPRSPRPTSCPATCCSTTTATSSTGSPTASRAACRRGRTS